MCNKLCNAVSMCEFCLDSSQVSRGWTPASAFMSLQFHIIFVLMRTPG